MNHDEDLLEALYWEFLQSKTVMGERLAFKAKLRFYANMYSLGNALKEYESQVNV